MNPIRIVRIMAAACMSAVFAAGASAQVARTPTPDLKGQDSQGFSVVLVLGDSQSSTTADTVPPAARRALADMKDFLPYKGYRLLDAQWILGSQKSTTRLRGPGDQEYQLALRSSMVGPAKMSVSFQLQEPGVEVAIAEAELKARRAQGAEIRENAAPSLRGRGIIDTTFSMDIGETVVVGTSRVRGADQALIALLTAVPRGTAAKKQD